MPKIIFDTSVMISRKPTELPADFLISAVVIQELTAGSADRSEVRQWEASYLAHQKDETLLVPTGEDWYQAGKILNALLRGLKSQSQGLTPKLHPDDKQRIIRDVLIARTAKRVGATVVTDNKKDFERIRRYCKVKVVSGDDYFGR